MNMDLNIDKSKWIQTISSYALAAVTGVIGLINWFILRDVVLTFLVNHSISHWAWQAIDNFTFIVFGICWLVIVLFSQYYYIRGMQRSKGLKNFAFITSIQLLLLVVCQMYILYMDAGMLTLFSILFIGIQSLIGFSLLLFSFYKRKSVKES